MGRRMLLYRGSLKSCNYHCSYCPFSKHAMSKRELEKDSVQWREFVQRVTEQAEELELKALLVTPYGEALIHPWYWEGLADLSALPAMDAVGAQTNLSFAVEEALDTYVSRGGTCQKLHLWATFHPEMTSVEEFVTKCNKVRERGAVICAGAVGVPAQIPLLQKLRKELPEEIYLWINRMDGLKRPYTLPEKEAFLEIDPYFLRELSPPAADVSKCGERLFVEGNGRLRTCNISRDLIECQEELWEEKRWPDAACDRRRCSCYLAYGGRNDLLNSVIFGPYPVFRVPRRPKAVFLDLMGTIVQEDAAFVSPSILAGIIGLYEDRIPLFFATTLPYEEAAKVGKDVWPFFQGGVFAGGAHLLLTDQAHPKEQIYQIAEDILPEIERTKKQYGYRVLTYQREGQLYKITLLRSRHKPWDEQEAETLAREWKLHDRGMRYIVEGACLQLLSDQAEKALGVRTLCTWLKILPEQAVALGDSAEDYEMMRLCEHAYRGEAL